MRAVMLMESISIFVSPRRRLSAAIEEAIVDGAIACARLNLRPKDALFHSGDEVDTTFYLARGLIRLYSVNDAGDTKTVFLHKAGSLIGFQMLQSDDDDRSSATGGETGLVMTGRESRGPYKSILNAEATANCEVFALDALQFRDFLKAHGDICFEYARYLFDMLANQTRESVNGSIYPVLERFAALLLTIANELNLPPAPAVVPFTNADLASMLGVHPNSVTNAIAALRRAECVERQHNCLLITDYRKLKRIAGDLIS